MIFQTDFEQACRDGDVNKAKNVLDSLDNGTSINTDGQLVDHAIENNHLEIVKLLGSDTRIGIDTCPDIIFNWLRKAYTRDNADILQVLLHDISPHRATLNRLKQISGYYPNTRKTIDYYQERTRVLRQIKQDKVGDVDVMHVIKEDDEGNFNHAWFS